MTHSANILYDASVTTADAIANLLKDAPLTRKELATAIGVSERSIARYLAGYEPGSKVLRELARIAKTSKVFYLHDLFESKRRADIVSAVAKTSAGSERRIPLPELTHWDDSLWQAYRDIAGILNSKTEVFDRLQVVQQNIEEIRSEIHLRVAPDEQSNLFRQFVAEARERTNSDGTLNLSQVALGPEIADVSFTNDEVIVVKRAAKRKKA